MTISPRSTPSHEPVWWNLQYSCFSLPFSPKVCPIRRASVYANAIAFSLKLHTKPSGLRCEWGFRCYVNADKTTHMLCSRQRLLSPGLLLWRTWEHIDECVNTLRACTHTKIHHKTQLHTLREGNRECRMNLWGVRESYFLWQAGWSQLMFRDVWI